jgi:hypothetical protein
MVMHDARDAFDANDKYRIFIGLIYSFVEMPTGIRLSSEIKQLIYDCHVVKCLSFHEIYSKVLQEDESIIKKDTIRKMCLFFNKASLTEIQN